jgi:hypothetical protein
MPTSSIWQKQHAFWVPLAPGGVPIPGDGNQDPNPPPPPPPGGRGMLLGASIAQGIGHDFDPSTQALAGPWTVARRYQSGSFANTWAADTSGVAVDIGKRASVYSCKPDLVALATSPTERARLAAFVASIPDSHVCFLEAWHELDVKTRQNVYPFSAGGLTLAQVNAGKLAFYETVKSVGKPHVYTCLILTNFSAIGGVSTGLPPDFWVGPDGVDRVIDIVSWDIYMTSDTVNTGAHELATPVAFATSHGAGSAISEIGIHQGVTNMANVATWMHNVADYAAAHGTGGHNTFAYLTWFDSSNNTALPVPSSDAALLTASGQISTQYLTPYSTFVL